MVEFSLFIIISFLGGIIGYMLKIPLGSMIGTMIFVGFFHSIGVISFSGSSEFLFLLQILLGAMLGITFIDFKKEYIQKVGFALIFIVSGVILIVTSISGILVYLFNFNGAVSILTSTPGAIYEMAMIAETIGVEAPMIVLAHFARILIIMSLFSLLMKFLYKQFVTKGEERVS
jgi:membrane AbrB-like protein